MLDVNDFDRIQIAMSSPEKIRSWSSGEVKKPETINYRTLRPEKDGLFCEKIFGPTKDWECACGKYKKVRHKGIICDKCGVEVTKAKVRRERMGHIELAAPVSHIWYFKGISSRMGLLLDMTPKHLEKVIYFASYIVVDPGDTPLSKKQLLTESEYQYYNEKYRGLFRAGMGAEAIQDLLKEIDVPALSDELMEEIRSSAGSKRDKARRRLELVEGFKESGNKPEWMILEVLPVIPPDLRPMVQLDGGRFATSDLNDLYRRVINRNNRLKKLLELQAPDIIVRNEKRMLQEAVDALIDNGRRGRPVTGPGNRPLKSLSDLLKGKQGRFRQNLLGKRVDYSGRSVIVVGPGLKLHQCGLPKEMALELFKPFVMRRLVEKKYTENMRNANKMVQRLRPEVWDVLEEVIREHPVLLNRAPTLHRLGIQAFEPVLVNGKAIQIHPMVCAAYNADFDGDQMAVHVPLSPEAQAEARLLMLSVNNILSPASGNPITVPNQDVVIGCYYLTAEKAGSKGDGKLFKDIPEALMAFHHGEITLHTRIFVRMPETKNIIGSENAPDRLFMTTVGKLIFNSVFPDEFPYINSAVNTMDENLSGGGIVEKEDLVGIGDVDGGEAGRTLVDIVNKRVGKERKAASKSFLAKLVAKYRNTYGNTMTAAMLDSIKELGYRYATYSGTTVGVIDASIPPEKDQILKQADTEVEKVERQYKRGLLTETEKEQKEQDIWTEAKERVQKAMEANLDRFNPIYMMATSGARGNLGQLGQLAGMRGLVADPSGRTINVPIRANFREGLNVLEYFISTHGTRKGLADTALRTAKSGYLTRRLVDVAQDAIVRKFDCGTDKGIEVTALFDGEGKNIIEPLRDRIFGRMGFEDIQYKDPKTGEQRTIEIKNRVISEETALMIEALGIKKVTVRSVLQCKAKYGVCACCYGRNLALGKPVRHEGELEEFSYTLDGYPVAKGEIVDVGEAVGIIAAQSIGEPGTQLTMRTFHTGGVAGEDITYGLPRVERDFEARIPSTDAHKAGVVSIREVGGVSRIIIKASNGQEYDYTVPADAKVLVQEGQKVGKSDRLYEQPQHRNAQDVFQQEGIVPALQFIVGEVQEVYRRQGVEINDKHIEVIVRQMSRKLKIMDAGDTHFKEKAVVDRFELEEINKKLVAEGLKPAQPWLPGIKLAAVSMDSFLASASFQETATVLTDAAIRGKTDRLIGLKENVIIGKLIPAGTGMKKYRNITLYNPEDLMAMVEAQAQEEAPPSVEAEPEQMAESLGDQEHRATAEGGM
ncbi:MAG TPA: DNA-directed RNA polymerase subunit beta' [Bacillota bacterium]|nr:DNA-directed RNA polymerase subunit beta' [Bacillota bacterium]